MGSKFSSFLLLDEPEQLTDLNHKNIHLPNRQPLYPQEIPLATVSSLVCLFYVPLLLYEPNISEDFLLAMHKIYKQTLHIDCKPMALLGSLHGNA